jgi:thiol:disulfide interchange protein DsbD
MTGPARWGRGLLWRTVAALAARVTALVAAVFIAMMILGLSASPVHAADEFLDPEVAFKLEARALDARRIELRFDVVKGYHLYRERFSVAAQPAGTALGALQMPAGEMEFDSGLQKNMEVYRHPVTLVLPVEAGAASKFRLQVVNQGCADQGLCYPPQTHAFDVTPGAAGAPMLLRAVADESAAAPGASTGTSTPSSTATTSATPSTGRSAEAAVDDPGRFDGVLRSRNLLAVGGAFLLAGLLLSFTPCVLPMLPILSSIIVGQSRNTVHSTSTRARGFSLALAYSLGMALVYTALGMAAGLAGEGLAAALQNAWVLGAFALLLVGLSLSMFGVYELQVPGAIQTRLAQASGRLQGGQYAGVFVMGGLSALIVGPCVAAPLAGALVYISQTRDVWLGGLALFSLAAGMSVPLLLMGLSAQSLLPRAGHWMERVKHFFGALLLAVALWMVSPVLPGWAMMGLSAILLLGCAVYMGAFDRLEHHTPGHTLTKGIGVAMAVLAMMQLVGVASGGRDPLQPLAHFAARASTTAEAAPLHAGEGSSGKVRGPLEVTQALPFEAIASTAALDSAVRQSARPVLVDFYADWCVSCKEMESLTFSDSPVRQRMANFRLLRIDVTANTDEQKALMRRYGLFGPPALLFFAPSGAELPQARVIGYQDAEAFKAHLDKVARL